MKLFAPANNVPRVRVINWAAMKGSFVMGLKPATKTGAGRVAATQTGRMAALQHVRCQRVSYSTWQAEAPVKPLAVTKELCRPTVALKKKICTMTPTPPQSGGEPAQRLPVWLLTGQRVPRCGLTSGHRVPRCGLTSGHRADAVRMPRGRTSRRMSRRRDYDEQPNHWRNYEFTD
jgi:hypothetical protein